MSAAMFGAQVLGGDAKQRMQQRFDRHCALHRCVQHNPPCKGSEDVAPRFPFRTARSPRSTWPPCAALCGSWRSRSAQRRSVDPLWRSRWSQLPSLPKTSPVKYIAAPSQPTSSSKVSCFPQRPQGSCCPGCAIWSQCVQHDGRVTAAGAPCICDNPRRRT